MAGETGDARRRDYIRNYYREADRWLGRVVEAAGPDSHVVVMSDHGHQGVSRALHLNGWLAQNGFLKVRMPAAAIFEQLGRRVRRRLRLPAKRPKEGESAFQKNIRAGELMIKAVVWPETKAYAARPGFVFVNLKGREAQGCVEPGEEFRRVRDEIREGLLSVVDPQTGERVFDRILVGEEIYHGPATGDAPDLVVLPRPGYASEYALKKGTVVGPTRPRGFNGYHVMQGMIAMAGPEVKAGARLEGARIVDVAPTILHLLGLPAQPGMDGQVLESALEPEALASRPVRLEAIPLDFSPEADAEAESESIAQSLKDLGYM
jgi:predicted AlkP superfamily phosphohydrolase/phosphomutase